MNILIEVPGSIRALCLVAVVCAATGTATAVDQSDAAVDSLSRFLKTAAAVRPDIAEQPFAAVALTRQDAVAARKLLADDRLDQIRETRATEMRARILVHEQHEMPFAYQVFGDIPAGGRSLYISLHGGGGAPARVNDQQWQNQQRLYRPAEGVYVAPRAPTDTWNLWHQKHIDPLLLRLIENMVAFEDVSWDRVYVMGYSAGGDGVYQLAPRMSDRWAAAAMMAGHPNEATPLGLRNVPFALQVGGRDAAYKRNEIAGQWAIKLADLQQADPSGYKHFTKVYPDKGHWMDREDAVALPWMASHTRNPVPEKIVWVQDNVTHTDSYWLGVDDNDAQPRAVVRGDVDGQTIKLSSTGPQTVHVFLDDRLVDLDQPVTIKSAGRVVFRGRASRTITSLARTLDRRRDPGLSFPAVISVQLADPIQ